MGKSRLIIQRQLSKQICYTWMAETHRQVLEQNTASLAGFLLRKIVFRHAYPKRKRIMLVNTNHECTSGCGKSRKGHRRLGEDRRINEIERHT